MSTMPTSLTTEPAGLTSSSGLADVLALLPRMRVSKQVRSNMASGIRTLCRVLDRRPEDIPIYAPTLRNLTRNASPGAISLSPSRWRNVRSDVNRAIHLSGLSVDRSPELVPLTDAWGAVALKAPDATRRSVLRRFGRFCSSLQATPGKVDNDFVDRFFVYLDHNQLSKTPERTVKDVIRIWNCFVAVDPSGRFTPLRGRTTNKNYAFPWKELPDALFADARAFKEKSLNPSYFDNEGTRKPVQPSTAAQRDRMLRRLAAAEMRSGIDPIELQSLADLVHPERLKLGLQFFIDRNDGKPNKQVFDMVLLAHTIARNWACLPEDLIATIAPWVKEFHVRQEGMTEKNRDRLRQFSDVKVIKTFLTLSDRLVAKARRLPMNASSALMIQKALAIALLTVAPLRLKNLLGLDRQRHFRHAFSVDDPQRQLVIPAAEVKNNIDLQFPVPPRIMEMIELYFTAYQPLLTNGHPSTLLFPGRSGQPKTEGALRRNITEVIYKETCLRTNPHIFRHLSAFLFLKMNPGQYESVRQLLGHKNIQTTINFYASFETDEAMHRFNQVIEAYREDPSDDD